MFLRLAVIYTLLGGLLLFCIDKYVLRGWLVNNNVFSSFNNTRFALLALLALLLLNRLLDDYRTRLRVSRRKIYQCDAVNSLLFNNSKDIIFSYVLPFKDMPAHFLGINPLACTYLGYREEEMQTFSLEQLLSPLSSAQLHDHEQHLTAGVPLSFEAIFLAKDGSALPAEVTLHLFTQHHRPAVLAIARNLTKRKALEEAVRKANDTLDVLARIAPAAIIMLDLERRVTRWNEAAELMFGWSEADVLDKVLPIVLRSEVAHFSTYCTRVLQGETLTNVRVRHQRKDGTTVDVSMCLAPTYAADGTVYGMLGVYADLTERIRTTEELLRVNRAFKVLSEAKRAIARATDEAALLHDICRILIEIGGYRFAWIGVVAPDDEHALNPLAYVGDGDWYVDVVNPCWRDMRQENNPTVSAIRQGKLAIVKNLLFFPDQSSWTAEALNRGYGAVIALPITAWRPYGALTIFAGELAAFDEEEVGLLDEMADDIAYGVESLRLRDERRRAEDALLAYSQQWRSTFDAISDPIYVVDAVGVITQCNHALAQLINTPYDKIIGRKACELLHGTSEFWEASLRSRAQETRRSESDIFPIGDHFYKVTFDPLIARDGLYLGSIQVMDDVTERKKAEEELKENFIRLQGLLNNTITAIAKIVEMRDPYTAGHEHRVSLLAYSIAREMGLPEDTIEAIRVSGMLHDIGKLYVPSEILSKTGALNEIELVLIKMHAQAGYETLKNIDFPWPVEIIVLQHHERINGSGYPSGLSGEDILVEARILAVADVVDSMASHRPYRPSRGIEASLQEIDTNSGILYDAAVVQACRRLFLEQGFTLDSETE